MTRPEVYDRYPEHTVEVEAEPRRVRVRWQGREIAHTDRARVLREADYPPVFYLPLASVDPDVLEKTDHTTHCPFKGDASYYSLRGDAGTDPNAVWSYESPFEPVAAIRGHVAFHPDRVEIEEGV